jgi:hypothetical protein
VNTVQRRPSQHIPSHSYGLWSLWDIMLKKAAFEWGRGLSDLRFMEIFFGNLFRYQLTPDHDLDSRGKLYAVIGNLKRICILTDLNDAIGPELDRFSAAVPHEPHAALSQRCDHLRNRIQDELANQLYFQVDQQDVQFYDRPDLFGSFVLTCH